MIGCLWNTIRIYKGSVMFHSYLTVSVVSLTFLAIHSSSTDQHCKEIIFHQVEQDSSLNNVFARFRVKSWADCGRRCFNENMCIGFRFNERIKQENCELSDIIGRNTSSVMLNNNSDWTYFQQPHLPKSCADILHQFGHDKSLQNGEYWIIVDTVGPMNVYCDMTTEKGGWTLVNNIVFKTPISFAVTLNHNWQAISNYTTGIISLTPGALGDLKKKMPFNQLRFQCFKKIPGRTFHVVTMKNTRGNDVVKYFTAQTDSFPKSCGSFYPMSDDNSKLSQNCRQWEKGYWSTVLPGEKYTYRLVSHVAYVPSKFHWISMPPRWECDDYLPRFTSPGDYWKIFVR